MTLSVEDIDACDVPAAWLRTSPWQLGANASLRALLHQADLQEGRFCAAFDVGGQRLPPNAWPKDKLFRDGCALRARVCPEQICCFTPTSHPRRVAVTGFAPSSTSHRSSRHTRDGR